jgi:hypothetical protein
MKIPTLATTARTVTPIKQHVHSFLEMNPLLAILCVVSIHWGQFLALFGTGPERARLDLIWKSEPLPIAYIVSVLVVILLFEFLPYVEEFLRGLRANAASLLRPKRARRRRAGFASSATFAVSIVNVPPSGIASRALSARFSSASSSWLLSQRTSQPAICAMRTWPRFARRAPTARTDVVICPAVSESRV